MHPQRTSKAALATPWTDKGDCLVASGAAQFTPTHWSVVLQAGRRDSPQAAEALEQLCRSYWFPIYAYVRRKGYDIAEAQDLTQEFFMRVLESDFLSRADRGKGRFRSFLLGALEHFLAKEWRRAHREKRGGGRETLSLDADYGEERYRVEPYHEMTAEKVYNQSWAMMLLEQAMTALEAEYAQAGKAGLFEALKCRLHGDSGETPYAEVAARMGIGAGAVRMASLRLRKRYGELVRAQIAQTVSEPADIDGEIRFLFASLPR